MKKHPQPPLLCLLPVILFLQSTSAIDFVFNRFSSSNISLHGNATIETCILTLTQATKFSIGRGLYSSKIPTKDPNSSNVLQFSTSFIFAMAPVKNRLPGHGIVFLFVPHTGIQGTSSSEHLGLFNLTNDGNPNNHVFGIEFDVFENQEFSDINDNHVGIDMNSLTSTSAHEAGYWPDSKKGDHSEDDDDDNENSFRRLKLNNGKNYQVWIDYANFLINVTMAPAGMKRPKRPLLSVFLDLSEVFEDEMYIGFTAATGALVQSHVILARSFSNSNFSLSEALITSGLPSFEIPKDLVFQSKGFIAGTTLGLVFVLVMCSVVSVFLSKRNRRKGNREEIEWWELEYWPHRIAYHEIELATKSFSEQNVIGIGGNGKVYKGVLQGGTEVAVKRISHENVEGMREFLSEISSLGRLKHRNLVGLRGWCKKEKGSLILVYDYMENGSLDKRVFDCDERKLLSCEERIRILKDVAVGVLYLHEGWEAKVLHRDIKANNVLLDKQMNARLGDFGLARIQGHDQVATTTSVVGTVGYLAPEVIRTGTVSTQSDVFGFGVLILEVMCGRRPMEEGKLPLVDWVRQLMENGELLNALDERLRAKGRFDEEEVQRVLQIGLLSTYSEPHSRPTMRQIVKVLEGKNEVYESEGEDMDMCLLEKMKSKDIMSRHPQSSSSLCYHPTFEELREGLSGFMSLSWSNSIMQGR